MSTPAAFSRAWSSSALVVLNRTPVSTPIGDPGGAGASATVVTAPAGATSTHR